MPPPNTPQDPYAAGDERDRSSGSTPPMSGSGSTPPPPPSGDSGQSPYGSPPPAYGSTPPAYGSGPSGAGSSAYGSSGYGSTPPAYGADYGSGQSPYGYGGSYPKNNLGVWSLVLGLVGIVLSCGLFTGIPAIIVGNRSRRAVAEGQANNPGLATAGIVLGWIATILSILGIIAFILLVATGALAEFAATNQDPSF